MTKKIHPGKEFLAGAGGSLCLVIVGHPADTIKVRLQTMRCAETGERPLYRNAWDCVKQTVKNEGMGGLYKGVSSVFLGAMPISGLSLAGYSIGKQIQIPSISDEQHSVSQLFLAGSLAGLINSVVLVPVERVKCLLQVQQTVKSPSTVSLMIYKGSFDCARQLYQREGLHSLYRGTCITILRGVPSWGIYFSTYEMLRRTWTTGRDASDDLQVCRTLLAGGTAGLVSWMVAMPADVLKSRLQAAPLHTYPDGVRDVLDQLIKKEGLRALYKGTTPIFVRAFPANAAFFLGYEITMKTLDRLFFSSASTSDRPSP